jgi:hypothetical protein
MSKLIKDVRKVGSDVYTRTRGAEMNLLEVLEELENGTEFETTDGGMLYICSPTLYTITVKGKDVDPKDVKIVLEDSDEDVSEYFYCDETGDELTEEKRSES